MHVLRDKFLGILKRTTITAGAATSNGCRIGIIRYIEGIAGRKIGIIHREINEDTGRQLCLQTGLRIGASGVNIVVVDFAQRGRKGVKFPVGAGIAPGRAGVGRQSHHGWSSGAGRVRWPDSCRVRVRHGWPGSIFRINRHA